MKIGIIGTGYVGLVTGVCLARNCKHDIVCIDINEEKIEQLKSGICPIFEPGLKTLLLKENSEENGYLNFSTSYFDLCDRDMIMIAVGTPQRENGSTDLSYILDCGKQIAQVITKDTYITIKSTAPVGTADKLKNIIDDVLADRNLEYPINVYISSNPEFLKEGSAIEDFLNPARIVIGADDSESKERLLTIYQDYKDKCFCTDVKSAQLIKYAANSFLATKISFVNSLIPYCEQNGINLQDVVYGMGTDPRIGDKFLKPGPGYGGSCFPKDVASLCYEIQSTSSSYEILDSVNLINRRSKHWPITKVIDEFYDDNTGKLKPITVAIFGLAFKPYTDDIRCSSSIDCIVDLIDFDSSTTIKVFDPLSKTYDALKSYFERANIENNIIYSDDAYDAAYNADVIIVMTDWPQFLALNMNKIKCLMKGDVFIDSRSMFDYDYMSTMFNYYSIGKPHKVK